MKSIVVVGAQWGDEGKGKVVDYLAASFDFIARCAGGHNAGHTVIFNGKRFVLQLIPCGILRPGKHAVIGSGVVVDPEALVGELDQATATFERAVAAINDVGLLAEEVDPGSGEMIGNFPQAFSHIGLVNAAWAISQAQVRAAGPDARLGHAAALSPYPAQMTRPGSGTDATSHMGTVTPPSVREN